MYQSPNIINSLFLCVPRVSARNLFFLFRVLTFMAPVLAIAPVYAQNGCCQVSASRCAAPVTQTYCEQQLKGAFQENVACRTDTGTCGVLAGTDVPMPLWLSLVLTFVSLLIFVIVVFFVAKRMRKSAPGKG